jgi:hypothetical protein
LDGKSSIWSLRRFFDGQSHEARCQPSFKTGAGVSPFIQAKLTLFDAKLSERSRQAERVFSVKPFLVLFAASKRTKSKETKNKKI